MTAKSQFEQLFIEKLTDLKIHITSTSTTATVLYVTDIKTHLKQ